MNKIPNQDFASDWQNLIFGDNHALRDKVQILLSAMFVQGCFYENGNFHGFIQGSYVNERAAAPAAEYNCLLLSLNSAFGHSLINIARHELSISKLWATKQDLSEHRAACTLVLSLLSVLQF